MVQSPQDWTKIVGVITTGISLIAAYTAYIFKQSLDDRKDRIESLKGDLNRQKDDYERQVAQLRERHVLSLASYERRIKELEQKLEESEDLQKGAYDTLKEILDDIEKDSLSSQDLLRFRRIIGLLEKLKDVNLQETLSNYKAACRWLRYRRDAWVREASENILQKNQDSFSGQSLELFQRDLRGYLDWAIDCMQVGHTQNNPLENFVASPILKSPYPYIEAMNYIQRKEDWGNLNLNQAKCLNDFLEKLIERLNEELDF